ncbi:MAG: hypothetical protein WCO25_05525 [Candidatus Uhrbacteria bacterium]
MRTIVAAMVLAGFFGTTACAFAQMTSTDYQIRWDTVGNGGDDTSSSPSYVLQDTTGNAGIGDSSSASYGLGAGYRQGVSTQVLDFSFFAQDNGVSKAATGLVGLTISCNPAGFTVGDMVALLQDKGADQVTAIGKIVSIGGGSITVDALKDGGVAPDIDGTNDFIVLLNGDSSSFGTLSASAVRTSVIGMNVSTSAQAGYVVQVLSDGDFRNGADTINSIVDGSVTVGSEEYGARSSDTTLATSTFDTADSAFTTSFQTVADAVTSISDDRNFLVAKAAIDALTVEGAYAQTLTLIVSGNY